ncbi:MAG: NAD-dependent protein deacylase [Sphingobacteriaceae bacterium]|nr:NAD-dependent protein deacylase [Sphingobacteriaceae bacterium]
MHKKKIVVFSGAGMSAESGIKTFRDTGGLWEEYKIEDVATYDAWLKNQDLVLDFYNQRRKQVIEAKPNEAHYLVAELQKHFDVQVITQNIDDLHERAGSKKVLHLHGEIMKGRSTAKQELVYDLKHWEIKSGDVCEVGSQIRPHIVWFGEAVPEMDKATELAEKADVFVTIGTSLNVYPAANLIHVIEGHIPKFLVDPGDFNLDYIKNLTIIKATAVQGMKVLSEKLKELI